MVVVSDTSPISALLQVGHLELLPKLFGRVVVPEKVLEELRGLRAFGVSLELLENAEWLNIQNAAPSVLLDTLLSTLDPGEAHAIALSVDLKADLLLIDERKGRQVASALHLTFTGVGGVLIRAKKTGLLESVEATLKAMEENAGFYLSRDAKTQIIRAAGE